MSASEVYHQVRKLIRAHIDFQVDESTFERIALLVRGMIQAKSASPAKVAKALERLKLSGASAESLERRIRRLENDPEMKASLCFHPFARAHLRYGRPEELHLILDPTTQEDKIVMVSVAVWFRGRALPLAWAIWPGNTVMEGGGFLEKDRASVGRGCGATTFPSQCDYDGRSSFWLPGFHRFDRQAQLALCDPGAGADGLPRPPG